MPVVEQELKRILIVDDETDIQLVTCTALEVLGEFETRTCGSAQVALGMLGQFRPDLILLDVMMPDLDGLSFLRQLKATPEHAGIPVIFLTARTQTDDIQTYFKEGVLDVISKPFNPEELIQKVRAFWKKRTPESTSRNTELNQKIDDIRQLFMEELPDKMREMEAVWQKVLDEREIQDNLKKLYRLAHSMTGAGGTFGFTTLSITARIFENYLRARVENPGVLDTEQKREITRVLGLLREAALSPDQDSDPFGEIEFRSPRVSPEVQDRRAAKFLYLVEDDDLQRRELMRLLNFFGFTVHSFTTVDELANAMHFNLPSVLIMDISLQEGPMAGIEAAAHLLKKYALDLPLIFITVHQGLTTHLQALRAGGNAFFIKPFDVGELVDTIDFLTGQKPEEPYRVLIVEDDEQLAAYYEISLQKAGIVCCVVTEAMEVLQPLREFRPDLILLDIYMPNCSGLELAAIIRQREELVGIAIVFLSSETRIETQFEGISIGAEDYLVKPINAEHLVSALLPRLKRSRSLRESLESDSLTGLLNHTKIKDQLDLQMSQTLRSQSPLSFAMIDIDHFKKVNDTYGHATGDRILKSLTRLLKQRLRKSDIIGRYGGEEFAVIMPATSAEHAFKVFDDIRHSFGSIRHQAGNQEFAVTFSCGIASWPDFDDPIGISDAADKALYRAKNAGRNQVLLARGGQP